MGGRLGQLEIVCLLIKHITYSNADWRLVSSIIGAGNVPLDTPKLSPGQTTHYQIVDPMAKDSIKVAVCVCVRA